MEPMGREMIVILEFFRRSEDDDARIQIATKELDMKTAELAIFYARGAIGNVSFDGKVADGCLVKSTTGAVICEVTRSPGRA